MDLDWKKNLGNFDRLIRIIIGLILIGITFSIAIPGWIAALLIIIALSQFVEAYFAY